MLLYSFVIIITYYIWHTSNRLNKWQNTPNTLSISAAITYTYVHVGSIVVRECSCSQHSRKARCDRDFQHPWKWTPRCIVDVKLQRLIARSVCLFPPLWPLNILNSTWVWDRVRSVVRDTYAAWPCALLQAKIPQPLPPAHGLMVSYDRHYNNDNDNNNNNNININILWSKRTQPRAWTDRPGLSNRGVFQSLLALTVVCLFVFVQIMYDRMSYLRRTMVFQIVVATQNPFCQVRFWWSAAAVRTEYLTIKQHSLLLVSFILFAFLLLMWLFSYYCCFWLTTKQHAHIYIYIYIYIYTHTYCVCMYMFMYMSECRLRLLRRGPHLSWDVPNQHVYIYIYIHVY